MLMRFQRFLKTKGVVLALCHYMAVMSTYSAVLRNMFDKFFPTVRWVRFSSSALKNDYKFRVNP
jgi:hypothetical protein